MVSQADGNKHDHGQDDLLMTRIRIIAADMSYTGIRYGSKQVSKVQIQTQMGELSGEIYT